ncbi:MAG TPA: hypothetical protein PK094_09560, partial [Bacteroidales bacterium]|nr:hypothetical protein [Bacteroidales bacterium]
HESFGNYSESLFVEYYNGKEAGAEYVRGTRRSILNDRPIIGIYNVNYEGSGDMYSKGGNMLHTLRQIINDDVKWRDILRGLNSEFYHQTVDGWQIEEYIGKITSMNLKPFFDQYLRDVRIPVFEYYVKGDYLNFRWNNCVPGFNMPVRIYDGDIAINLNPSNRWNTIKLETSNHDISVDKDYYISVLNMMGR